MLGPAESQTERTPDLMAEAGLIYHTDWRLDDQPVPIKVKSGKMVAVPYTSELNDGRVFIHNHEAEYFALICKASSTSYTRKARKAGARCA